MENSDSVEYLDGTQSLGILQELEHWIDQDISSFRIFPILKPTRSGFMPVLDLDVVVDPGIDGYQLKW